MDLSLTQALRRICELQPKWTSVNTEDMQERGVLIRTVVADQFRNRLNRLQKKIDSGIDDLAVEGSDGIGRKTEAPWVRFHPAALSPTPREGFYFVLHFAADGSAIFLTVGCGSTIWRGGDLIAVADRELKDRTNWARDVIRQRWNTLEPFSDQIDLGAKAKLPRTFEKATAVAKRIALEQLEIAQIEDLLDAAIERLGQIYLAQLDGRDISQGDLDADEIKKIAKPSRNERVAQGRGLSADDRKCVELHAMRLAQEALEKDGYQCKDTSQTESFDMLASKEGLQLKVEVKGTTGDLCDSVVMTRNEVELHRAEKGDTALLIVSGIRLDRSSPTVRAKGGVVESLIGWDIDDWLTDPIAFQVTRRNG